MSETPVEITASVRSEILIDRSVITVWGSIFEFPKWAPTIQKAELLSGEWDKEGCRMLITKKDWVGLRPFYSELIKSRPYDQQVYRNVTKDGAQLDGFVDLGFSEVVGGTRVVYSSYFTVRLLASTQTFAGSQDVAVKRDDLQNEKGALQIINDYLRPLKEFAEGSR
jgi:hypothetical protein